MITFLTMVTWQFSPESMHITFVASASCQLSTIFSDPAVLLQEGWSNLQQFKGFVPCEWACNYDKSVQRVLHSNRWRGCSGFVFSKHLRWFSFSASLLRCLWIILDIVANLGCCFFFFSVSLASQILSVSVAGPITYRLRVLEAAKEKGSALWD